MNESIVLIDTNVAIYFLNDTAPYAKKVENWIVRDRVAMSVITVAELLSKSVQEENQRIDRLLSTSHIEPVDIAIAKTAASMRRQMLGRKNRIVLIDCLIGATAMQRKYVLATADRKGFPFKELKFAKFR